MNKKAQYEQNKKLLNKYVMVTGSNINTIKDMGYIQNKNQRSHYIMKNISTTQNVNQQMKRVSSLRKQNDDSKWTEFTHLSNKIQIDETNIITSDPTDRKEINFSKGSIKSDRKNILTKKKSTHIAISNNKRIKTEDQPISPMKRFNTDLSLEPDFGFLEDHHNTESLAQLIQQQHKLTPNGNIIKQNQQWKQKKSSGQYHGSQQINIRSSKYSQSLSSSQSRKLSLVSKKSEDDQDDQDSNSASIKKSRNRKIKQKKKQSQNVRISNEDQSIFTGYTYIDGKRESEENLYIEEKKRKLFAKKATIRTLSSDDKIKILSEAKYTPKTEQELRMQQRYINGQATIVKNIRQAESLHKLVENYQNNRKRILQQSMKKSESAKLIHYLKNKTYTSPSSVILKNQHKVTNQIVLPVITKKSGNISENNMSIQNFVAYAKQKKLATEQSKKSYQSAQQQKQIENVQYIEQIFKRKGISYDKNSLEKGLYTLKTLPDYELNEKLDLPKSLISNPRYKQYPL